MISHTYQSAADEDCRAVNVKAREVRKICTSHPFRNNCAVQQVLNAVFMDCLLGFPTVRCHPQAYGYFVPWAVCDSSACHVAC